MPAYFDLSLQFLRKDLYPGFVADFDAALDRAGLRFFDGFWEDEGLSQAEIAVWNQQKLDTDFVLGMTTHRSQDYKQTLYSFGDYEEVRGFWMNQYPAEDAFIWFLIIPEHEVLVREGSGLFQTERAAQLIELAKGLWQFPAVRAIQTGLEFSDGPVKLTALRTGELPSVQPFAILEQDCRPPEDGGVQVAELAQGRPGRLLLGPHEIRKL